MYARRANTEQSRTNTNLSPIPQTPVFVLAPFVAGVSHTKGSEGQRDSEERGDDDRSSSFYFQLQLSMEAPHKHPTQLRSTFTWVELACASH